MPPNLRKSQPNLSKPSEGGSFNAGRKPSESTNPLQGLNISAERELGSTGGVKATGRLTVGVDNLIGQQGIDIEIDATNRTAGAGIAIGSTKGKLGVNIGGKVGYGEDGAISIKGAEAGINIGGFGGSASIDSEEGVRGSISVAGAKVEIGVGRDGKKTMSLCYSVPGGELCVTLDPDDPRPPRLAEPLPAPSPDGYGIGYPLDEITPLLQNDKCYHVVILWHVASYAIFSWDIIHKDALKFIRQSRPEEVTGGGVWTQQTPLFYATMQEIHYRRSPAFIDYHEPPDPLGSTDPSSPNYGKFSANFKAWGLLDGGSQLILSPQSFQYYDFLLAPFMLHGKGADLNQHIAKSRPTGQIWDISAYEIACPGSGGAEEGLPRRITPTVVPTVVPPDSPNLSQPLPNYPQQFKRMDCCAEIKEIHRYLGIAKLKKNKFPVSNAFLVPGGKGADKCIDYYAITQALFRMLANGLIINPKSKPLGSEWQNANATAWASAMYEMMAESMSDGNSSQRFEVAAIMQLAQMMSTLAENGRKIEFVADAIGLEPQLVSEELPICFTVYEGHKGFGKKEPKKINTTNLKTDDDVEAVLGKMLAPSKIPITAWKFKPGHISINEALRGNNG